MKAAELYDADRKLWEDYYAGKRVSGFHPSWERKFGKTRPPVFTPEQREFLNTVSSYTMPGNEAAGASKSPGEANPFKLENQDLKLQAALLERTPALAEQLIVSAGRDPRLFGL